MRARFGWLLTGTLAIACNGGGHAPATASAARRPSLAPLADVAPAAVGELAAFAAARQWRMGNNVLTLRADGTFTRTNNGDDWVGASTGGR